MKSPTSTSFDNQPPTTFGTRPAAVANGTASAISSSPSTSADPSTYSTRDPQSGRLRTWKNRPVEYVPKNPAEPNEFNACYRRADDNQLERIWFPDGPPGQQKDAVAPEEWYADEEKVGKLKEEFDYVRNNGAFKDGVMPDIPPKADWVAWDI